MKKLVTSFFLLLGLSLAADGGYAQQAAPAGPVYTKAPKPAIGSFDSKGLKTEPRRQVKGAKVPLSEPLYMLYVDLDGELTNWTLPRIINFQSGETDTVVYFMQRFTNPYESASRIYLDSAFAFVQANRIVESNNNNLQIDLWYAQQPNDAGVIFPLTPIGTGKTVKANTLNLEETTQINGTFRTGAKQRRRLINFDTVLNLQGQDYEVHPTDFFVSVRVPFFSDLDFEAGEQNEIGVIGDAQFYEGEFDPEIHRGMALGFNYFIPWNGITNDAGESFYANFAIIAKVSDEAEAVKSAVDEESNGTFTLMQNYPNPFNPSTTIEYSINETMPVAIKVFNTMGVEVATLVNEVVTAGEMKEIKFDASNLPSGNYIYTMTAGGKTITKAMTLAK